MSENCRGGFFLTHTVVHITPIVGNKYWQKWYILCRKEAYVGGCSIY